MCVSETVWKGRLIRRCERLEIPSFVFNTLVRQVPALSTPPLSLLFFFSPRSSLPDTFFALTLERYSFIPTIACLLCFISLRNSWAWEGSWGARVMVNQASRSSGEACVACRTLPPLGGSCIHWNRQPLVGHGKTMDFP